MSASAGVREHENEPVPGLPERLPPGEHILWQGSPSWRSLARHAFHTRKVAAYFALLVAWSLAGSVLEGREAMALALNAGRLALLGAMAVGMLALLAWLNARATIYTLTTERVVLRFGVALTLAVNLPLRAVHFAGLRSFSDGSGDIPLSIEGAEDFGYVMLWPFARAWHFGRETQPMLRGLADPEAVAGILGRALDRSAGRPALRLAQAPSEDEREPAERPRTAVAL